MRSALLLLLCAATSLAGRANPNTLTPAESAAGWHLLFDGRSLDGWRASDDPGTFSTRDGLIVVKGPRSHLYYIGPVADHVFRDFELSLEVRTFPQANSGVYFHTAWQPVGWPAKGYEVQVNTPHSDPSRTAGLWGIQAITEAPARDGEWFTLVIRVQGRRITTAVDGRTLIDYTEPAAAPRPKGLEQRLLDAGTFALQGHDPGSEVHFRSIKVRAL